MAKVADHRKAAYLVALILVLAVPVFAYSKIRLPKIIGTNMVIQRDADIKIWGWANPAETVTIEFAGNQTTTETGENGKWSMTLPLMKAGGPHKMTVTGKNTLTLENILVGEVWICSGQSNMEWRVAASQKPKEAIDSANYPNIHLFHIPKSAPGRPMEDTNAAWNVCSPSTVPGFSAVGYFFGQELHNELNVPVGIINASWSSTRIEPWTPPEGFALVPELKDINEFVSKAGPDYKITVSNAVENIEKWVPTAKEQLAKGEDVTAPPVWPRHPLTGVGTPTAIHNGMIHPIVPFAIRGAIWYQGESNMSEGMLYYHKMRALISGWRKIWNQGDFPFYYVQLAPFTWGADSGQLPKIWEAQTAVLKIPNTGMAVINDIGNILDVHPRNKVDVAKRLSLWALAKTYGRKDIVYSGPLFKSAEFKDGKAIITFDHVGGGLASRDSQPLNWFELAGEDKKFIKAEAVIEGEKIIVSSPEVTVPVAVRFAWDQTAEPNLINKESLPASAFRSDDW